MSLVTMLVMCRQPNRMWLLALAKYFERKL